MSALPLAIRWVCRPRQRNGAPSLAISAFGDKPDRGTSTASPSFATSDGNQNPRHAPGEVWAEETAAQPIHGMRFCAAELRRRGIPTVTVCGACIEPVWGPFYRGWLATRRLDGAHDLWTALSGNLFREAGTENVWRAVADTLRRLHREGVCHTDLNLKNILVRRESDSVKGYVIDFDKATLFLGSVPPKVAQKNLDRLLRSVCKLDPVRKYASETDWNRFVDWYHGAAG